MRVGVSDLSRFREDRQSANGDAGTKRWISVSWLVPMAWIEHATSPLPRECSTTELRQLAGSPGIQDGPAARASDTASAGDCKRNLDLRSRCR